MQLLCLHTFCTYILLFFFYQLRFCTSPNGECSQRSCFVSTSLFFVFYVYLHMCTIYFCFVVFFSETLLEQYVTNCHSTCSVISMFNFLAQFFYPALFFYLALFFDKTLLFSTDCSRLCYPVFFKSKHFDNG